MVVSVRILAVSLLTLLLCSAPLAAQGGEAAPKGPGAETIDPEALKEGRLEPAKRNASPKDAAKDDSAAAKPSETDAKPPQSNEPSAGGAKGTEPAGWENRKVPRGDAASATAAASDGGAIPTGAPPETTLGETVTRFIIAALIIAVIVGVSLYLVRRNPRMQRMLGGGPIKLVSRAYLGPRTSVMLVKVGDRVLVVGQTSDELRTLSEITDPMEVTRLLAQVEQEKPDSMTATFRDALSGATLAQKKAEAKAEQRSTSRTTATASTVAVSTPVAVEASVSEGESVDPGYAAQVKLAALSAKLRNKGAGQ